MGGLAVTGERPAREDGQTEGSRTDQYLPRWRLNVAHHNQNVSNSVEKAQLTVGAGLIEGVLHFFYP